MPAFAGMTRAKALSCVYVSLHALRFAEKIHSGFDESRNPPPVPLYKGGSFHTLSLTPLS
jgi:hypothetical protein